MGPRKDCPRFGARQRAPPHPAPGDPNSCGAAQEREAREKFKGQLDALKAEDRELERSLKHEKRREQRGGLERQKAAEQRAADLELEKQTLIDQHVSQRGRLVQKIETLKKETSDQQRLVNDLIEQQTSAEALERRTVTSSVPLERECTVCMESTAG